MSSIDLGFAKPIDRKWRLKNKYFPSKIGGKPVFLDLKSIPNSIDMKCIKCQKMLRFLLQIYAPIDSKDNAFHRTLFVFCCLNNHCNHFRVLRSQLSRINSFYSSDPPNYECDEPAYDPKPDQFGHNLCTVCGLGAKNKCSKCLEVSYCSKEHQMIDWREGKHKQMCGSTEDRLAIPSTTECSALFPELELTIGDNQSSDNSSSEDNDNDNDNDMDSERNELRKYESFVENVCPEYQNQNFDTYEENVSEEQKAFNRFKRLSSGEVIRYCTYEEEEGVDKVEPLWISSKNKPNVAIPNCQYCNSERRFEFQVMPQLLNKIVDSDESLDWGTLVVYTCAQSCSAGSEGYKEEFIWNQTIS